MAVCCENSFDGKIVSDVKGHLHTRKPHSELHGFGIDNMRTVAEKYGSILDITYSGTIFTVQTVLKLPN